MILIQNGRVIDPRTHIDTKADILIRNGRIDRLEASLSPAGCTIGKEELPADSGEKLRILDASGMIVAPGLIDTHVHFRDPGQTHKEDISTGAQAAAAGGYTSVIMMANTRPPIDDPEILSSLLDRAAQLPIHVYSCANATRGMAGKKPADLKALAAAGARGFTDDGVPIMEEAILKKVLEEASRLGLPVSLHEEDPLYITEHGIDRGETAAAMGMTGADREAEISMIRRDIAAASDLPVKLVIQHISTAEGVELVRQARKKGLPIHAEATPQHMSLTSSAILERGTAAKVNPPLRTEQDRQAILEGVCDGTIDLIATDHAPHSEKEKAAPFRSAPSGMIGLETALSLCLKQLVISGRMSLSDMLQRMTDAPAALYNLPAGSIAVGMPADIVIFAPEEEYIVPSVFRSRSCNSPFTGEKLPGVIHWTIAGGRIVFEKKSDIE